MIIAYIAAALTVTVAAAVVLAHLLTRKGSGSHHVSSSRSHRAEHAERQAADWAARIRPHLPRAGCMPMLDTALLEPGPHGWDPTAQLPTPGGRYDTGEMPAALARGDITPAEVRDHLAGKYLPAPEATP